MLSVGPTSESLTHCTLQSTPINAYQTNLTARASAFEIKHIGKGLFDWLSVQ